MNSEEVLQHINGQRTAENFIDECVLRRTSEPEMLYRILVKLRDNDAALYGFAEHLHKWMECEHAN